MGRHSVHCYGRAIHKNPACHHQYAACFVCEKLPEKLKLSSQEHAALLMVRKTLKLSINMVSNLHRSILSLYTMTVVQTQSSPFLVLFVCAPDNFLCALLSNKLRLECLQNVHTLQCPCGRRNGLVMRIQGGTMGNHWSSWAYAILIENCSNHNKALIHGYMQQHICNMTAYYLCLSLTGTLSREKAELFLYHLRHFSIPYQVYPVHSVKEKC